MKDVIREVFVNYFICVIVGGIFEYVAPPKARKHLKICVLCIMLLSFVSPLLESDVGFQSLSEVKEIKEQEKYDSIMHTSNLMEKALYSQAKQILINFGVDEYEIYIDTSYDEDENIVYVDSIMIEVGKDFSSLTKDIFEAFPEEYKKILKVGVKND